jgi:hypothetical protein
LHGHINHNTPPRGIHANSPGSRARAALFVDPESQSSRRKRHKLDVRLFKELRGEP